MVDAIDQRVSTAMVVARKMCNDTAGSFFGVQHWFGGFHQVVCGGLARHGEVTCYDYLIPGFPRLGQLCREPFQLPSAQYPVSGVLPIKDDEFPSWCGSKAVVSFRRFSNRVIIALLNA